MASDNRLPRTITRPLIGGAVALGVFLVALIIWSVSARLTTSIQVSGNLASSRPSFDIQHPFGGPIDWVGVSEQENVVQGDVLFELDVSVQKTALNGVQSQLRALVAETDAIRTLLATPDTPLAALTDEAAHYAARQYATKLRKQELVFEAAALREQVVASDAEQALLSKRIALQTKLQAKQIQLLEQGLTREAEVDGLSDQILELSAELQRLKTQQMTLKSQAIRAESQAEGLVADFTAELLSKQQENSLKLMQLGTERDQLVEQIEAASIKAPVAGHIHALKFPSARMYAPRGQTLAVIAQNLDAPVARLTVSPRDIDQVSVGMTGKLAITSLPQREMPPLEIVITALSPEAEKDAEGKTRGYIATATIDTEGLAKAESALQSRFRLVADMPVTATLTGRQMTFADYVIKPFTAVFIAGLQD